MSREVANMPYAGAMAIQLVPSVLECIGSAWYAQFLQKASALATPNSLMAIAQYETHVAKASNWANVIQASMQDMARNPQYWTSFARVAGTDYVDAVNDGASQISRLLFEEATDINFYVGRAINPAHQNPDLPITFSIKMNLVKDLSECLKKMGKRIKVSYF